MPARRVHGFPGRPARLVKALRGACRRALGGRCAVCRGWCDGALCHWCRVRFASARERCDGCATPVEERAVQPAAPGAPRRCARCHAEPLPWAVAVAGVEYAHPWDRLLADFKFHDRVDLAEVLLAPLRARLEEAGGGQTAATGPAVGLVPIPLSRERLRERGYNQSWELARRLASGGRFEARAEALFRVRDTAHQLGLSRGARDDNLRGAFVVSPAQAAWVRGRTLALVDDVLTTGATAGAAARALRAAGAHEVRLWVVARAPE